MAAFAAPKAAVLLLVDEFKDCRVQFGSPFLFKFMLRSDWSKRYACIPFGSRTEVWILTEVAKSDRLAIMLIALVELSTILRTWTFSGRTPAVEATLKIYLSSTAVNAVLAKGKVTTMTMVSNVAQDAKLLFIRAPVSNDSQKAVDQ